MGFTAAAAETPPQATRDDALLRLRPLARRRLEGRGGLTHTHPNYERVQEKERERKSSRIYYEEVNKRERERNSKIKRGRERKRERTAERAHTKHEKMNKEGKKESERDREGKDESERE